MKNKNLRQERDETRNTSLSSLYRQANATKTTAYSNNNNM